MTVGVMYKTIKLHGAFGPGITNANSKNPEMNLKAKQRSGTWSGSLQAPRQPCSGLRCWGYDVCSLYDMSVANCGLGATLPS